MTVKAISSVLAALSLVAAPISADAACYTPKEWQAAHVQVLQRYLQVTMLECRNVAGANYDAQYTAFIARFSDQLRRDGKVLHAHFHRVYGGAGESNLDVFVTRVTNDASSRSMRSMTFCKDSAAVFQSALAIPPDQLDEVAVTSLENHSLVGDLCPVTATATAPHKSKHRRKVASTASAG